MFLVLGVVVALGVVTGQSVRGPRAATIAVAAPVPWLLGAGLTLQVALRLLPDAWRTSLGGQLVGASALLVAAALVLVARPPAPLRPAALLALAGGGLNAAVMLANGGMPVSVAAAERAAIAPRLGDDDPTARHVVLDDDTRLAFLADVVPLRVGPERAVFSAGDVVLLAAAARASHAMARHRHRASAHDSGGDRDGASLHGGAKPPTPA